MPQTESAKKALRASQRRRVINDRWRRKFRASFKAVNEAINAGDATKAQEQYITAQSDLDRASRRHIIHRNTAARRKARLSRAINKLKK